MTPEVRHDEDYHCRDPDAETRCAGITWFAKLTPPTTEYLVSDSVSKSRHRALLCSNQTEPNKGISSCSAML